jgi:hypothetical protein
MKTKIIIALVVILGWQIEAQTVTNTPASAQAITNKEGYVISPEAVAYYHSQGWSDAEIANAQVAQTQTNQVTLSPTPPDLKNAYIWMDNFIGMTNANLMADVIGMKAETLKFRLYGKDYDYSGHYTVVLNTPRKHANPYFGLGSPETAKILILENVGGDTFPLQNATIWEKKSNFIDAVAMDKEWIYSGTYTIQN